MYVVRSLMPEGVGYSPEQVLEKVMTAASPAEALSMLTGMGFELMPSSSMGEGEGGGRPQEPEGAGADLSPPVPSDEGEERGGTVLDLKILRKKALDKAMPDVDE